MAPMSVSTLPLFRRQIQIYFSVPSIFVALADSRWLLEFSDDIFRFNPLKMEKEEIKGRAPRTMIYLFCSDGRRDLEKVFTDRMKEFQCQHMKKLSISCLIYINTWMEKLTFMSTMSFKKDCNVRESNPGLPRGRREFYH